MDESIGSEAAFVATPLEKEEPKLFNVDEFFKNSKDASWSSLYVIIDDLVLGDVIEVHDKETNLKKKVTLKDWDRRCGICFQSYDPDSEQPVRQLECNHTFHIECIKIWLKIGKKCPLCLDKREQTTMYKNRAATTDQKA
jgi:hypothetical protein